MLKFVEIIFLLLKLDNEIIPDINLFHNERNINHCHIYIHKRAINGALISF